MKRSLTFMESQLAASGTGYLVGDRPTLADLAIIVELDQLNTEAFSLFDFAPYPHISAWMTNVSTGVPSYKKIFLPVVEIAQTFKA